MEGVNEIRWKIHCIEKTMGCSKCQELYDTAKAAQHKQLELEPDAASKRDLKRILDVEQIDSCFRCQRKSEEIAKLKILLFNARYNEYNE